MNRFGQMLITTEDGIHVILYFVLAIVSFLLAFAVKKNMAKLLMEEHKVSYVPILQSIREKNGKLSYVVTMCNAAGILLLACTVMGSWNILVTYEFVETTGNTDDMIRGMTAMVIGIVIFVTEHLYEKIMYISKSENDMYVDGIVTGTHNDVISPYSRTEHSLIIVPGYKRLVVEYTDPYDGRRHIYKMTKEVRFKKHPVGSTYRLRYSREKKYAYDEKSERINPYIKLAFLFMGGMLCFAGVLFLLRGFGMI